MVWMTMTDREGHALYLQLTEAEQRLNGNGGSGTIFAVQATVGNGIDETAVLLEIGTEVVITFIDEWLDIESFRAFMARYDRAPFEQALKETARSLAFCTLNPPCGERAEVFGYQCAGRWQTLPVMGRPQQLRLPTIVAEEPPVWRSVA